jgi:hypothetical protein
MTVAQGLEKGIWRTGHAHRRAVAKIKQYSDLWLLSMFEVLNGFPVIKTKIICETGTICHFALHLNQKAG